MSAERLNQGLNRGVSRVLSKLEVAVQTGNYYEAHQMYRTLYFRYNAQKKFDDCLDLLHKGSITLINKEQYSSAADLVLLLLDTLEKKSFENKEIESWIGKLGMLIKRITPSTVERETIINRSIRWSGDVTKNNLGSPQMHKMIAQILWAESNIELARHHYLLSRDGLSCGQMLIQLSQNRGYTNEIDLFIAQVVLQQLCLKETKTALDTFEAYTKFHPKIASTNPPFIMPLLNFIFFLLKTIEMGGRLAAFKSLCDLYKPVIKRDPSYEKYLHKIGILFFGVQPPQTGLGMGGMFGDLFNRLFQDFDDEEADQQQSSINQNETNELD